jgi:hypothetical protein
MSSFLIRFLPDVPLHFVYFSILHTALFYLLRPILIVGSDFAFLFFFSLSWFAYIVFFLLCFCCTSFFSDLRKVVLTDLLPLARLSIAVATVFSGVPRGLCLSVL